MTMKTTIASCFTPTLQLTVPVPDVDKVEADDVVAGVAAARRSLVQAVDVEAGSEYSPDAQNL